MPSFPTRPLFHSRGLVNFFQDAFRVITSQISRLTKEFRVDIFNRNFTIKGVAIMNPIKPGIPPQCCTLNISGKSQERLVNMFKALGNPVRFEVIKFLVTHPGCITGDIVKHLPIAQATVSQHLKVLKEAGWISGNIDGTSTCYQLDEKNIAWFRSIIGQTF
jgi:ArsR family transcriptional regulator, arsenate/arsenite/antimonite-responsive transcriptional repressor